MHFSDRQLSGQWATEVKSMLMALEDTIPGLLKMEVGINISERPTAFDLVLTADFEDESGLNTYRNHPDHVKVLAFLKDKLEKTAVADYFI